MFHQIKAILFVSFCLLLLPVDGFSQPHTDKTVQGAVSGFDCAVVEVLCPATHRVADYTKVCLPTTRSSFFEKH